MTIAMTPGYCHFNFFFDVAKAMRLHILFFTIITYCF